MGVEIRDARTYPVASHGRGVLMRMRIAVLLAGLLLLGVSCGEPDEKSVAAKAAPSASAERVASKPEWAQEGERLKTYKREKNAEAKGGSLPGNAADFAFQSEPLVIDGAGEYTVQFSKLPGWFDFPKNPTALTSNLPPDTSTYFMAHMVDPHMVRSGLLEATLVVSEFETSYSNYTIWIY